MIERVAKFVIPALIAWAIIHLLFGVEHDLSLALAWIWATVILATDEIKDKLDTLNKEIHL